MNQQKANLLTLTLSNKVKLPQVGFGTYRITEPEIGINAIKTAIDCGYVLLDTADIYKNHQLVATAIKQSTKTREDLFITTKLWPSKTNLNNYEEDFDRFLKELDTDYIDLLLVHWPLEYGYEAYQVAQKLYKAEKVRAIGVSNYNAKQLEELINNVEIVPMVNQIELNPKANRSDVVAICDKYNIKVTSWQTIMSGKIDQVEEIVKLAKKYHVDAASIALRWAIQKQIAIIPKSVTPQRIISNIINLDKFILTPTEMQMIDDLSDGSGMQMNSEEYKVQKQ